MLDGMEPSTGTWTFLLTNSSSRSTRIPPSAPVVDVFDRDDGTTVAVYGEIDFDTAPAFHDALRAALDRSSTGLDLELDSLTFCDGAGLRVLLRVRQLALDSGRTVRLCSASPLVARLLCVTHTHDLFTQPPSHIRQHS
ncbi:STAS domain-containing protein [Streptomyces sp. NPDC051684]|uniref:STAS domain-containing protein n=1 Tax=Streptomyces sp. NPDC051684 TaxID=3365670 RepID=UPI0037956F4B